MLLWIFLRVLSMTRLCLVHVRLVIYPQIIYPQRLVTLKKLRSTLLLIQWYVGAIIWVLKYPEDLSLLFLLVGTIRADCTSTIPLLAGDLIMTEQLMRLQVRFQRFQPGELIHVDCL